MLKWQLLTACKGEKKKKEEGSCVLKNRNNNADFEGVVFLLFQIFHNNVCRHCREHEKGCFGLCYRKHKVPAQFV